MPLIINKKVIDLSSAVKEAKLVKEKVAYLRDNLSEDGKHIVFVWDDTKQRKTGLKKFIRGFRQSPTVSPQGQIINLQAQVLLFPGDGLADVVYVRRAVPQRQGEAIEVPKEKLIFQGRQMVNLDRQPDLAFFLYFCCPLCRGGENSNGSNVYKVEHQENEALIRNDAIRSKLKVQTYALNDKEDGGLSAVEIREIAVQSYKMSYRIGEQQMRQAILNRVIDGVKARKEFIAVAEAAILARGKSTTTAKTPAEPAQESEAEVDESEPIQVISDIGLNGEKGIPGVAGCEIEPESEEPESEEPEMEENSESEEPESEELEMEELEPEEPEMEEPESGKPEMEENSEPEDKPRRKPRATKEEMRQREIAKKRAKTRAANKKAKTKNYLKNVHK